jgi:hypothetical protein
MVIQDMSGRIVSDRTPGQKFTRLVWLIARAIASVVLTVGLFAMLPQLAFAFFGMIGLGWFIKNGANVAMGMVKGVGFGIGAVISMIWKNL